MDIRLRIDHVVVDGAPTVLDPVALAHAIQTELALLLTERPVAPSAVAVPVLHGPEISELGTTPAALGAQIASVVHAALPHEPGELTP